MTWHCLVALRPLDPATGERPTIRIASANLRSITGKGVSTGERPWVPAMIEPPATSMTLFNGSFDNAVKPGGARLPLSLTRLRPHYPAVDGYFWPGALVEIYIGKEGDPWPWTLHFAGRISSHTRDKDLLALAGEVDEEPFRANVLTASYAGTTGAEGSADLKDKPKPLILGFVENAEPVLIDAVNSVYQFSAYGPIESIVALYERASAFGPPIANYATYAALVAATIPPGRWATCRAQGMVRLGAPAAGVITGDVRGHVVGSETPTLSGAIIRTLANLVGVPTDRIEDATLTAMDVACPYPVGILIDQQMTLIEAAKRLALPCNHQAGVSLTGKLFTARIAIPSSPALTLHAQGKARPQVIESKELAVSPPYSKTIMGARRAWRVHTADEIAFAAALIERGMFDPAETYREGHIVSLPDGSRWLYTATSPGAGHTPIDGSAYWSRLTDAAAPPKWTDILDSDPEHPKPQDGADVTGENTSKDTNAVGGVPAAQVNAAIAAAKARQDTFENVVLPAVNQELDAANDRIDQARQDAQSALDQGLSGVQQSISQVSASIDGKVNAKALEVTTAFQNADSQLAQRATLLEATTTTSSLARNDRFILWPDGQQVPTFWGDDVHLVGGSFINRMATNAAGQPYCMEMRGMPGYEAYAGQAFLGGQAPLAGGGYYVVEADAALTDGTPSGSGVLFRTFDASGVTHLADHIINFATDPSDERQAPGFYTFGYRTRWSKLFQVPAGAAYFYLYAMTHWSGIAPVTSMTCINWFGCSVRPANAREIAAGVALPALQAQVSEHQTALTDGRFATAQALQDVAATAGTAAANASTALTAVSDGRFALASSLNQWVADYGGTRSTVEQHVAAINGLNERNAAFWQVTAIAGGRAQLRVYADANSGGGVDIVGDLSVSGNILLGGSVLTHSLANNAVTQVAAASGGSVIISNGQTGSPFTLNVNVYGGQVRIDAQFDARVTGQGTTGEARATIIRLQNGVETVVGRVMNVSPGSAYAFPSSMWFIDTPAAGGAQYFLRFSAVGERFFTFTGNQLAFTELKK